MEIESCKLCRKAVEIRGGRSELLHPRVSRTPEKGEGGGEKKRVGVGTMTIALGESCSTEARGSRTTT